MAEKDIGSLVVSLEATTASFEKGMQQATKELQRFGGASKAVESTFSGFQGAMFKFNVATQAFSTAMGLVQSTFAAFADLARPREQLRQLQSSFESILGSASRASDMMKRVMDISNELGTSIPETADAVRRMTIGLKQLGSSNAEIETITKTFLKLGAQGGSVQEATASIFQFSQALGSGVLRGDELISLLERQPLIAQKIAEYMKSIGKATEGTTGELRKLASEGKVTSQILRDALLAIAPKVAEDFEKMPKRMDQVLNQISNSFFSFKVKLAEDLQLNENITVVLQAVQVKFDEFLGTILDTVRKSKNALSDFSDIAQALKPQVIEDATLSWQKLAAASAETARTIGGLSNPISATTSLMKIFGITADDVFVSLNRVLAAGQTFLKMDPSKAYERIANIKNRDAIKAQQDDWASLASQIDNSTTSVNKNTSAGSKNKSLWEQWIEGIKKSKDELDLIPKKLEYLYALLAKAPEGSKWAEKLKDDIDKLKAANDPLETFRQSLNKTVEDSALLEEKLNILYVKMSETKNAVALEEFQNQANQIKEKIAKANGPIDEFALKIQKAGEEGKYTAEKLRMINDAVKNGALTPEAAAKLTNELKGTNAEVSKLAEGISDALDRNASNAVNNFIDTLGQAKFSFADFTTAILKDIAKMIMQLYILKPLMESIRMGIGGFFGGSSGSGYNNQYGSGNAGFGDDPNAMRSGVVTSPTLFKFATGGVFGTSGFSGKLGVMGEAGPEAVMPLRRDASGNLGVTATSSPTTINVYNNAGVEVQTAEKTNEDGSKQISIMIERKVKEMFGDGSMDKSMRSSYGLSRAAY